MKDLQLWDVHECLQSTNHTTGVKTKRWKSTLRYNLPYAIARRIKQVHESNKTYPKGTFFELTKNGEFPDFMKPKTLKANVNKSTENITWHE